MKPFADPRCTKIIGTNPTLERQGVYALPLEIKGDETASYWAPSDEERAAIAAGGTIRLRLLHPYHPPAAMTVEPPGHNKGPDHG